MNDTWSSIRLIWDTAWRLSPRSAVISFAEAVGRVLTSLNPLMIGLLVGAVVQHDLAMVVIAAVGMTAAQGISMLLVTLGVQERLNATDLIRHDFDHSITETLGTTPTLGIHFDPAIQDEVQAVRDRLGSLGWAFNALVNIVNNLAGPVTTLAIAAVTDLRLLLLVIPALLATWAARFPLTWEQRAENESAPAGRLSAHLTDVTLEATSGAELRVLGARGWAAGRLTQAVRAWRRPFVRAGWKSSALQAGIALAYLSVAGALLAWIVSDALHGRVSPARVATAVLVVGDLREAVESGSWAVRSLSTTLRTVRRVRNLRDFADAEIAAHPGQLPSPTTLSEGIRVEGVTLSYPGATSPTLRGLELFLPAGRTVAIVGENGAGKSTIIGLLTGMLDPDTGRVTIDGTDLRELDLTSWRRQCSGAFQDHAQLELTAREAIGAGDVDVEPSDAVIGDALQRAAATDVMRALPAGLDTQLGTQWPEGVGLSGGQWQRLAIARGMMRRRPLLMVLDEPTSALDPATEHALFDRYAAAARETNAHGGVTVLVTHRFSTVAAADLVVVLDAGQVVEQGTHAELMALGGRYAELYELQAAGYR